MKSRKWLQMFVYVCVSVFFCRVIICVWLPLERTKMEFVIGIEFGAWNYTWYDFSLYICMQVYKTKFSKVFGFKRKIRFYSFFIKMFYWIISDASIHWNLIYMEWSILNHIIWIFSIRSGGGNKSLYSLYSCL